MEPKQAGLSIVQPHAAPAHVATVAETPARDRLIRMHDVESLVALRKSSIYALVKVGKFPQPVRISKRCTAWPESAVLSWVQGQIAAAGAAK